MRISDVASAAGTTPRTVRHYHRLGCWPSRDDCPTVTELTNFPIWSG
ncbi:MerR family transcriptional regulator [Rhodococcus erythropolis]